MAKKRLYITSDELRVELTKLRDTVSEESPYGVVSEKLGGYFLKLVDGLGSKRNFSGYTYVDEMKGKALQYLIKYSHNFKENPNNDKKSNPFAYCTKIAYGGFLQYIKKEHTIAATKEEMYDRVITRGEMLTMNTFNSEKVFDDIDKATDKQDDYLYLLIEDLVEEYNEQFSKLKYLTRKSQIDE
jgi:hypothetical protein